MPLALLLAGAALMGLGPSVAAGPAQTAARALPILIGSNVNGAPPGPAGQALALHRLAAAGVSFVRFDILWTDVERQPGVFDFRGVDARVAAVRAAGLRILGILDYGNPNHSAAGRAVASTPLSGGVPPFGVGSAQLIPPDDPHTFARFAGAVAAHLRGQVMAYEIWNEENEGWRFWFPHEDPAAYARLLRLAHDAVRVADPAATVLFGGVFFPALPPGLPGMAGDQFLAACYSADPQLDRGFEAVAYHPYPYPFTSPEYVAPIRGSVISARDAMHAVMAAHGDGSRPLWISEVGWPTHRGYGVSPEKQAEYLVRTAVASATQGIATFTWYTYGDFPDPSGGFNQEAAFGLFDSGGAPKPAYSALDTMTATLDGTNAATVTSVSGADHAVVFTGAANRRVTVVWNSPEGGTTDQGSEAATERITTATVPVASGAAVRAVSMTGQSMPITVNGTAAQLSVSAAPAYVIESAPTAAAGVAGATVPSGSVVALPGTTGSTVPATLLSVVSAAGLVALSQRRRRAIAADSPRTSIETAT